VTGPQVSEPRKWAEILDLQKASQTSLKPGVAWELTSQLADILGSPCLLPRTLTFILRLCSKLR
jgi:hypothetical protein